MPYLFKLDDINVHGPPSMTQAYAQYYRVAMSMSDSVLIAASHGGGANVFIQNSAATQEGSSVPRSCPRSSGAARIPLGNVAVENWNRERTCKDRPGTATGITRSTHDGCFNVVGRSFRI